MTPRFYHDPVFSVVETADLIGVQAAHFRTLLARAGSQYIGLKQGARVLFTAHEVYLAAIAAALVRFGYTPDAAFRVAFDITGRTSEAVPDPDAGARLTAETADKFTVECNQALAELGPPAEPSVVLPLHAMWRDLMDRCGALYAAEAA